MSVIGEVTKQPSEIFPIGVDFTPDMESGDTLTTATVTAKNMDTGASSTATVLTGLAGVATSTDIVTQAITGGTDGDWHRVQFKATTTAGRVYEHEIDVRVIEA